MDVSKSGPGKWSAGLSALGAVGLVIYAFNAKKTGKFWYFLGGAIAGGIIGSAIDSVA
jgi:hypothetical protein